MKNPLDTIWEAFGAFALIIALLIGWEIGGYQLEKRSETVVEYCA